MNILYFIKKIQSKQINDFKILHQTKTIRRPSVNIISVLKHSFMTVWRDEKKLINTHTRIRLNTNYINLHRKKIVPIIVTKNYILHVYYIVIHKEFFATIKFILCQ